MKKIVTTIFIATLLAPFFATAQAPALTGSGPDPDVIQGIIDGTSNDIESDAIDALQPARDQYLSDTAKQEEYAKDKGFFYVCDGVASSTAGTKECGFGSIVYLLQRLIDFAAGAAILVAIALFAWAGVLYIFNNDAVSKGKAKGYFTKTLIGLLLVIGAWTIVSTITTTLLADDKDFLDNDSARQ